MKIINPDYIDENSGYRYYSLNTLLNIPIVKYYKEMGYTMSEIKNIINSEVSFENKIYELEKRKRGIEDSLLEINDWYNLIREAEIVRLHKTQNVNLKKKKEASFCFLKQNFSYDYKKQIINIEWRNYLDSIENEITVPVIFKFEDYEKKIKKENIEVIILQKL